MGSRHGVDLLRQPVPTHRLLSVGLLARATLLSQAATTVALGWLAPGSLTARILATGGVLGEAVLIAMTGVVVAGVADVVLNDLLGVRWRLVRRREHAAYMVLGLFYWMQGLGGAYTPEPGAWVLLANYVAAGGWCVWYGWISAVRGGRT